MTASLQADPIDEVWDRTALSEHTAPAFTAGVAAYAPGDRGVHRFVGPAPIVPLRPVRDRFQRLLARRRSTREFGVRALTARSFERILASVGPGPDGRRVVPEAGGLDAVHVYAIARRVAGPAGGNIVRYDHRRHAVSVVGRVPDDAAIRRLFLFEDSASLPQVVIVFVLDTAELEVKYGARGARFALQQVGHAAQNVGLRLAHDGLRGYVLGGGLDVEVLTELGIAHAGARYGGAMACGR